MLKCLFCPCRWWWRNWYLTWKKWTLTISLFYMTSLSIFLSDACSAPTLMLYNLFLMFFVFLSIYTDFCSYFLNITHFKISYMFCGASGRIYIFFKWQRTHSRTLVAARKEAKQQKYTPNRIRWLLQCNTL